MSGLRGYDLTIKDVIDILCHYNMKHCEFPLSFILENHPDFENEYFGGCAIDDKKTIYINSDSSLITRRKAIIHELYHAYAYLTAKHDLYSFKKMEQDTKKATERFYKKLYSNANKTNKKLVNKIGGVS